MENRITAELELYSKSDRRRVQTEWAERARRARRRGETEMLDLGLSLVSLWFADLARLAWGDAELVRHSDRLTLLRADGGRDPLRLRTAVEAVEDTRLRFKLNVSEDLACEALAYRLERLLAS
jgi:DNA polymerase-3 subunit delta'